MANYVLLERTELNASAASVTFANIPQTGYTDLKIVMSVRTTRAATDDAVLIRFNGSSTNFTVRELRGTGSSTFSGSGTTPFVGYQDGNTATSNTFSNAEIYIPNYAGSTNKSFSVDSVQETNATGALQGLIAGLWSNTAAITSITLVPEIGPNFVANSTFSLYGLAALGTTPAIAPKASGGNIDKDSTYWYHTFLTSGTFTPQTPLTCEVLVVAGGGASGYGSGGGAGGAGGISYQSGRSVSSSTTVTVGAGGAGTNPTEANGGNGSNSVFDTIISNGGGGGGGGSGDFNGVTGGSGGAGNAGNGNAGGNGAAANQGNTGGATGYGNAGGNGNANSAGNIGASGGGGGAGAAGTNGIFNGSNAVGGNGGNGLNTWSSWATATSTGDGGYYAGGGAGFAGNTGAVQGTRGLGGGGASGAVGTVNTGGGAGGAAGANGGSGIVIIRYPIA
jgi:hypothetical protein